MLEVSVNFKFVGGERPGETSAGEERERALYCGPSVGTPLGQTAIRPTHYAPDRQQSVPVSRI